MHLKRRLVILTVVILALSGCAPESSPTPTPIAVSPTPTPAAVEVDPTVVPTNVFGIDCADLVSDTDLASVFGAPIAPRAQAVLDRAELVQDGALVCEWGEPGYEGSNGPHVTVAAAPYGRSAFDALIASYAPSDQLPATSVPAVGDVAWAACNDIYPGVDLALCWWAVAVGDTWIVVSLNDMPSSEVAVSPVNEYSSNATPIAGTSSALLMGKIAQTLGSADPADLPEADDPPRTCESLLDWASLAAEFGLGTPSFYVAPPRSDYFQYVVRGGIEAAAAAHRGALHCTVNFESEGVDDAFVDILPGAGWLGAAGALGSIEGSSLGARWEGWGAPSCHRGPGGESCTFSGFTGGNAVSVSARGLQHQELASRIYDLLAAS